jgi:hypothetical protein
MDQFLKLKEEVAAAQAAIFGPVTELLAAAEEDAQKYYGKGVKSAGNRLKKKLQEIRKATKGATAKAAITGVQTSAKVYREALAEELKTK